MGYVLNLLDCALCAKFMMTVKGNSIDLFSERPVPKLIRLEKPRPDHYKKQDLSTNPILSNHNPTPIGYHSQ